MSQTIWFYADLDYAMIYRDLHSHVINEEKKKENGLKRKRWPLDVLRSNFRKISWIKNEVVLLNGFL